MDFESKVNNLIYEATKDLPSDDSENKPYYIRRLRNGYIEGELEIYLTDKELEEFKKLLKSINSNNENEKFNEKFELYEKYTAYFEEYDIGVFGEIYDCDVDKNDNLLK